MDGEPTEESPKAVEEEVKPYQLIEKHLGIQFQNPPKEIVHDRATRPSPFSHFHKELDEFDKEDLDGQFFRARNVFMVGLNSTLLIRLHETMHALHADVDPSSDEPGKRANLNLSLQKKDLNKYKKTFDLEALDQAYQRRTYYNDLKEVSEVAKLISEGIAEWGAIEVFVRERVLKSGESSLKKHLKAIEMAKESAIKEGNTDAEKPYIEGHIFVTEAMEALYRKGIPVAEALTWFMRNPPHFQRQLDDGGMKYVERCYEPENK